MFLLNSRSPLVTATSSPQSWHPFSRSYGAILPSSFAVLYPSHLRLLTLGTCVSSRYGHLCGFSRDPGLIRLSLTSSRVSHRNGSPIDYRTLRHPMTGMHELARAVTRFAEGHTNINAFPFRTSRLRMSLGPANPRLMNIAEEPWPLRWCGFSPHYAATLPWILICTRSTRPYDLASTRAHRRATSSSFEGSVYR